MQVPIGTRYPFLRSLTVHLDFLDDSEQRIIAEPETREFAIDRHRGAVQVDCKMRECIDGGFDLTEEVIAAIESRKAESSGTKICQGGADKERVGYQRCLARCKYRIQIEYQ